MGHARALITASDPQSLAEEVIRRGLSVRDTERLARQAKAVDGGTPRSSAQHSTKSEAPNDDIAALERQLGDILGLHVRIAHADTGGTVTLFYSTLDQLDMVCQRLSGEKI